MKNAMLIFSMVFLLFFGCGKNLQETPQSTIDAFIENVAKLNETSPITIDQAKKVLKTLFSTEKAYEAFSTTFKNIEIEEYTFGEAKIEDFSAKIPVKMKTKGLIGLSKEEERELIFSLEKKDAKWFISDIAGILAMFEKKPVEEEKEEEKNSNK